jgi:hypothetical protein
MIQNTDLAEGINEHNELIVDDGNIKHLFEKADLLAVWAAYHAGRPLLLRGKPGTGKSQLAKAIAHQLGWAFVSEVMHGGKELDDLHWQYDAINRLGEAQSLAYRHNVLQGDDESNDKDKQTIDDLLAHKNYIRPGSFWWAFDWGSAQACLPDDKAGQAMQPHKPKTWDEENGGVVLLIDEIDKAEPDLPNGLLQTLGDLEFTVPYVNERINADPQRLLIIITTNEERELPTALVRRCYTHTLKMDETETTRIGWLEKRGKLHFKDAIDNAAYTRAAELLWEDRKSHKRYPPGLAEYLDLLRPLSQLPKTKQKERLEEISEYVYKKEAEE